MQKTEFNIMTMKIAKARASKLEEEFLAEVERLINSGALDPDDYNRSMVFSVSLENMAMAYRPFDKINKSDYNKLRRI